MVNFHINSHLGAVDAHPGAMEAHHGDSWSCGGSPWSYCMKVHPGDVEAGLVMIKAHHSSRCAYRLHRVSFTVVRVSLQCSSGNL
jgi:hypothetical protein